MKLEFDKLSELEFELANLIALWRDGSDAEFFRRLNRVTAQFFEQVAVQPEELSQLLNGDEG